MLKGCDKCIFIKPAKIWHGFQEHRNSLNNNGNKYYRRRKLQTHIRTNVHTTVDCCGVG